MKAILSFVLVVVTMSCTSQKNLVAQRQMKMNEFKQLTKDVCRDNPHEVKLAQVLYKELLKTRK